VPRTGPQNGWQLKSPVAALVILPLVIREVARLVTQLQRSGPIRNVITRLRTKSGEIKLTTYSADRIQFDGQSCILAVSEDLPEYDQHKAN
jgi:hypothetical protein